MVQRLRRVRWVRVLLGTLLIASCFREVKDAPPPAVDLRVADLRGNDGGGGSGAVGGCSGGPGYSGGGCEGYTAAFKCDKDSDCATSGRCIVASHICATPNCWDGVKNSDETDIDCGGQDTRRDCGRCDFGQGCRIADDCKSKICTAGRCCRLGDGGGVECAPPPDLRIVDLKSRDSATSDGALVDQSLPSDEDLTSVDSLFVEDAALVVDDAPLAADDASPVDDASVSID